MKRHFRSSSNPTTPAADQIDSDEDSDGTRNPIGIAATCAAGDLRTPPNSFVDPSAFKQAFEEHYKEMQHTFLAGRAAAPALPAAADAEGRPLQEALRAMRAGIPGQQHQTSASASASASASSTNQGRQEDIQ